MAKMNYEASASFFCSTSSGWNGLTTKVCLLRRWGAEDFLMITPDQSGSSILMASTSICAAGPTYPTLLIYRLALCNSLVFFFSPLKIPGGWSKHGDAPCKRIMGEMAFQRTAYCVYGYIDIKALLSFSKAWRKRENHHIFALKFSVLIVFQ